MTTMEASKKVNAEIVRKNRYVDHISVNKKPPKSKVGDSVSISEYTVFDKGYTAN